jgi:glycosyltransferase involved in cell wall biosynthesis
LRNLSKYRSIKKEIRRTLRSFKPDVVHIHALTFVGYLGVRLFHAPIVATPWGSDIVYLDKKNFLIRWAVKKLVREALTVTCDAVHMKQRLVELGAQSERVELVFFGTNVHEYSPRNRDETLGSVLFNEPDSRIIISTRALNPLYDVATLIRAIPLVIENEPTARFIIVGGGEEKDSLEALSRQLGVERYVTFSGRLSDDDLKRYVASADIYVSTALSDGGLAASTAEAMASGVPVIVTDFGDNEEWLDAGKTGLTFQSKDYHALAQKLVHLIAHSDKRKEMGKEARRLIVEKNNYHREMQRMLGIYQNIVDSH